MRMSTVVLKQWLTLCLKRKFLSIYLIIILLGCIAIAKSRLPQAVIITGGSLPYDAVVNLPGTELYPAGTLFHFVEDGENLYRIGRKYFVTVTALQKRNQIKNPNWIQVHRRLEIPAVDYQAGVVRRYQVKKTDTLTGILKDNKLAKWQYVRLNPNTKNESLTPGGYIYLPRQEEYRSIYLRGIGLMLPVRGSVSSRYGWRWGRMHYGLDLAAPSGAPIRAAAAGRVSYAGWYGGYGLFVRVNHGPYATCYGHMSRILVRTGTRVSQGGLIGLVGSTGNSRGSHLHFELERSGRKVNPSEYLWRR